jgi:hypothetical protein
VKSETEASGPRQIKVLSWLSSPTQITYRAESAPFPADLQVVSYVISNSATGAGAMMVLRPASTTTVTAGTRHPWYETVTLPQSVNPSTSSVVPHWNVSATDYLHYMMLAPHLTRPNELQVYFGRSDNGSKRWRWEVVQWPGTDVSMRITDKRTNSGGLSTNTSTVQEVRVDQPSSYLLVAVDCRGDVTPTATYGGVEMTLLASRSNTLRFTHLFGLAHPPVGVANVVATHLSGWTVNLQAVVVQGVASVGTPATATASSLYPSVTVSAAPGDIVLAFGSIASSAAQYLLPTGGRVVQCKYNTAYGNDAHWVLGSPGDARTVLGGTLKEVRVWVMIGVALTPAFDAPARGSAVLG